MSKGLSKVKKIFLGVVLHIVPFVHIQVYYELVKERAARKLDEQIAIVRIEQVSPLVT